MMFSEQDIRRAITTGELIVEPFRDEFLRSSGIVLHLGATLLKPRPDTIVDVKNGVSPSYDTITLTSETPYALTPGDFVLGATFQKITVGPSLGFLIEGRSTLARVGLTIVQTAMLVYPGHRNRAVTLELANHGANTILLYPRMKIARVALFELKTPSQVRYDDAGKYREQGDVGAPIFKDEIWEE
jgi:dCTP deaminase